MRPKKRRDFATDLRRLVDGKSVPHVGTVRFPYRHVTVSWLDRLADHVDDLESILATIVAAWESVPENVQVPDEINVDEMWDEARRVLGRPQSGG